MNPQLVEALRRSTGLLFDFDGPLSDVFAGRSASSIADELKEIAGLTIDSDDPLVILREAYRNTPPSRASAVEHALVLAERDAALSSAAEPDGVNALRIASNLGYKVAVVTNNDGEAAAAFLKLNGLAGYVSFVAGRPTGRPELMKPDEYLLRQSLSSLRITAAQTLFVGDSLTDIDASRKCGMACVAFANKPGKRQAFEAAGATVIIDTMTALVDGLDAVGART